MAGWAREQYGLLLYFVVGLLEGVIGIRRRTCTRRRARPQPGLVPVDEVHAGVDDLGICLHVLLSFRSASWSTPKMAKSGRKRPHIRNRCTFPGVPPRGGDIPCGSAFHPWRGVRRAKDHTVGAALQRSSLMYTLPLSSLEALGFSFGSHQCSSWKGILPQNTPSTSNILVIRVKEGEMPSDLCVRRFWPVQGSRDPIYVRSKTCIDTMTLKFMTVFLSNLIRSRSFGVRTPPQIWGTRAYHCPTLWKLYLMSRRIGSTRIFTRVTLCKSEVQLAICMTCWTVKPSSPFPKHPRCDNLPPTNER